MGQARAKRIEYAAAIDEAGSISAGGAAVELGEEWSAEALVLAGLLRCSLTSLRYHARRQGIAEVRARGAANGVVTKRESDGRFAFVELEAAFDVEIDAALSAEELGGLLANAERDCFVGASLTARPEYRWRVNGSDVVGG